MSDSICIALVGCSLHEWSTHVWLSAVSCAASIEVVDLYSPRLDTVLHLQKLSVTAGDSQLLRLLLKADLVLDPCPIQVDLLAAMGIHASVIKPECLGKGAWTAAVDENPNYPLQIGLPSPRTLIASDCSMLCLGGPLGPGWHDYLRHLAIIPEFPIRLSGDTDRFRYFAAWLLACIRSGLQLIRVGAPESEGLLWQALDVPTFPPGSSWMQVYEEVKLATSGTFYPLKIPRPRPSYDVLREYGSDACARVSICISSYNYSGYIVDALNSCVAQECQGVELILVDDASTDRTIDVCLDWIRRNESRFVRLVFVRHHENAGLAAARNTGFALSRADWCFVLDADNLLYPAALHDCLNVADSGGPDVAVVHPLIDLQGPSGESEGLVGDGVAWSREAFRQGNTIDAMALIRRSAWAEVNGYSDIPFGWEDYDFWCQLVDCGFVGVQCPRILAVYRRHPGSMLTVTNQHADLLARILKTRHPWLQIGSVG